MHHPEHLKKLLSTAILCFLIISGNLFNHAYGQCAMCKAVIIRDQEHAKETAKAINSAIIYMIGITYSVIAVVSIAIFLTVKKKKQPHV